MPIDFSDPSLDYSAAEAELLRQQEAIKAIRNFKLLDSGAQPQPFTSAVTGTQVAAPIVKRPLLSALSPLIADTTYGREQSDLMNQRAQLTRSQTAAFQKELARINKTEELPGPPDPITGQAPTRTMSPEDKVAATSALATRFPLFKEQGMAMYKQALEQPEKDRKHFFDVKKQQNLQAHQTVMELQGQARIDADAGKPFPVAGVGLFQKTGIGADGLPTYRLVPGSAAPEVVTTKEINGRTVGLDKGGNVVQDYGPVTKPPDNLPVDIGQKYFTNQSSINQVNSAIQSLNTPAGKDSTGAFTYARKLPFGDKIIDAFNPDGTPTRALIQEIRATKVHSLAGTAQAIHEVEPLKAFIPSETDTYEQAMVKLNGLAKQLNSTQGEIINYAKSQGYKLPNQEAGASPVPPPVKGTRVAPYPEGSTPPAAAVVSKPAAATPAAAPAAAPAPAPKPEAPRFKPEQRASFGKDLMAEWKAAKPEQRGAIEQRALSVGATYNGREYLGGPFNEKSSWK